MSYEQKMREDEVFSQDISLDDLDAAAGGFCDMVADAMTPSQETIDEYR